MIGLSRQVLLGSGGHVPTGRRETCCALVRAGDRVLVIDAGTGLRRLVTDPALLDGVRAIDLVLTHFHLDHVVGLSYLPALGDVPVTVHGPGAALYGRPTAEILGRLLGAPLFAAPLDRLVAGVEELAPGAVELGPFALRARAQPRHSHPTLALRVGDELAYCTDTAHDPENVHFASGAATLCHDAWFHEGAPANADVHASGRQAAQIAREAGVGELVLIHPDPTLREHGPLLAEARVVHPRTRLGEDLLELTGSRAADSH
jgi:ribonuclease BN (tRNA processing enzyme)